MLLAGFCLANGSNMATGKLHQSLIVNVLRSPMSFFDTTPLGRIINRFSKDVDAIDVVVPEMFKNWFLCFLVVTAAIIVISMGTPLFMIAMVPMSIIYYFIQVFTHCFHLVVKKNGQKFIRIKGKIFPKSGPLLTN